MSPPVDGAGARDGYARAPAPSLLAVAHGTRCPDGQAQVRQLVGTIQRRRPDIHVRLGYLDIEHPRLAAVAARLRRPAVVVPLLFTGGYHVRVDIPDAVRGTPVVLAPPLAPDPAVTAAVVDQLATAGATDADGVVLAAAGSRDPGARAEVRTVAADLAAATNRPVIAGYASAATPGVATAVATLRAAGAQRVAIAALLLAEGRFHGSLRTAGGDLVTAPLHRHPAVVDLVLRRYAEAAATVKLPTRR